MSRAPSRTHSVAGPLLRWYRGHGRDLPWRRRPDPYRVWVSEIMLQQTTVASAAPYFERFVRRFPAVEALAAAREEEVLALWSGLGYYHRARNMLKAARLIVERHGGRIPADLRSLRELPGVGAYTAGAILSIGHNRPFPALDGNVARVAARLGGIEGDPARADTRRAIEDLVRSMLPAGKASAFNQALMDLGATVCLPRGPRCGACPVEPRCRARQEGLVERIPPPKERAGPLKLEMAALAVRRGDECLLVMRGDGGLMKGMWEFPMEPSQPGRSREAAGRLARRLGARVVGPAGRVRHTITRHRILIHVYEARPARGAGAGRGPEARRARAVSEAAARLANQPHDRPGRWVALAGIASGAAGLALTGAARKVARALESGPARPWLPGFVEAL